MLSICDSCVPYDCFGHLWDGIFIILNISKLIGEYTKFASSHFEILNLLSTTINDFTVQEIKLSPF